jgi:hypothetical protein
MPHEQIEAPDDTAVAKTASPGKTATCLPVTYKSAEGPASCETRKDICAAGAPYYLKGINALCGGAPALQRVNIISEPPYGGDPGVSYCVAWTGSSDGTARNAALLMDAPRYQCGAELGESAGAVTEPGNYAIVFHDTPQDCAPQWPGTRLTYPAVLDYSSLGDQEPRQYVCLTEHTGA